MIRLIITWPEPTVTIPLLLHPGDRTHLTHRPTKALRSHGLIGKGRADAHDIAGKVSILYRVRKARAIAT